MDAAHAHSIQFRLDDDAVHRTSVERLKTDAAAGEIDYASKPRFALDYARGYAIRLRSKNYRPRNWCEIYGPPQ